MAKPQAFMKGGDGVSEQVEIDSANAWRLETPGHAGWSRTARPDDAAKYFMVSADGHVQEPNDLWATRMGKKFADRLNRDRAAN